MFVFVPDHLLARLVLFAVFLSSEFFLVSSLSHSDGARLFNASNHLVFLLHRFGILSYAAFLAFGYPRLKAQRESIAFNAPLFVGHLICFAAVCTDRLASMNGFGGMAESTAGLFVARVAFLLGIPLLALACLPLRSWIAAIRMTRPAWFFALLAGAMGAALVTPLWSFWEDSGGDVSALQMLTFRSVAVVLRLFSPNMVADPATFTIGTQRFLITIASACSGLEGLGLILAFTSVWLIYRRKENRFPQALLLVPCALASVWLLNVARICALILIGDAGAPTVALVGFHSQAGWIAFTGVAIAFSMATQELSWVRKVPSHAAQPRGDSVPAEAEADAGEGMVVASGESPAVAAYLLPFLAILAASFVSKAASGYFEWLYPLRFFAALFAIWYFRAELKKLNWRFGWLAPLTGSVIFLVWIASSWWLKEPQTGQLGASLAVLAPSSRFAWIAFRVAAAIITVPIAEELAFRGFLARRLIHREFDTVPFMSLTALAIVVSSAAFGLLHGQHWMVGIVAGLAYAGVLKWRGRFGDAVVAHATSNILLAAWVLSRGDWAQW
jgi:exosortase E/protease (VPEID-CTERM system)